MSARFVKNHGNPAHARCVKNSESTWSYSEGATVIREEAFTILGCFTKGLRVGRGSVDRCPHIEKVAVPNIQMGN